MDLTLHKTKITSSKGSVIQIPQVKAKYIYGIKMIKEIYFSDFSIYLVWMTNLILGTFGQTSI